MWDSFNNHRLARLGYFLIILFFTNIVFAHEIVSDDSGGMLTVDGDNQRVLLTPIDNLSLKQQQKRRRGHAFFNTLFISDASEVPKRSGLGPLFIGASCEVCHNRLGRGRMPDLSDTRPLALVFQLSTLQNNNQWQALHPVYGENFNPFSIANVPDEGRISIKYKSIKGYYNDGMSWELLAPEYEFSQLSYGPFENDSIIKTAYSPRIAQSLIGMGLLEAIPDEEILENADPDDLNNDGISGRAHRQKQGQNYVLGRFGWKAEQKSLRSQITAALQNEQGIKTTDRPESTCTASQVACLRADLQGKEIELIDEDLEAIVFFTQTIPVPKRRNSGADDVKKGEDLFNSLSCQKCHIASFTTKKQSDFPLLSKQRIHPYTDLLLHDMGEQLADNRPIINATGREWRTAPLWGIGLNKIISGSESYLHDGRATTLEQAILWHGGEAEASKESFIQLDKVSRDSLIAFLESL